MTELTRAQQRHARRRRIAALARRQDGILSRRQLYAQGLSRGEVRAEIGAGRWAKLGAQCVRVAPSADGDDRWWRALLETGSMAVLDGVSSLIASGLSGITEVPVHVVVPKSSTPRRSKGVAVHETRRHRPETVLRRGVPRTKPATAAVHAVLWAKTDAQAALFLMAAVQQRLVTVAGLAEEVDLVRWHPRRTLLRNLLADVTVGIHSMGEREFALLCKARGFPEPTRQALRVTENGRVYYDAVWEQYADVTVEIDGAQHREVAAAVPDALKQNAAMLTGALVLRVPLIALRTNPEPFLDQLDAALRRNGWPGSVHPGRPPKR